MRPLRFLSGHPVTHLVGLDAEGRWVATDIAGRRGGWFRDRAAALRFAQTIGAAPETIQVVTDPGRIALRF